MTKEETMKPILASWIALALVTPAAAQSTTQHPHATTGNTLLYGCLAAETFVTTGEFPSDITPELLFDLGVCMGHIDIALEYIPVMSGSKTGNPAVCIPARATVGQYLSIMVKYLQQHPENRNLDFNILMGFAAKEAWPCP